MLFKQYAASKQTPALESLEPAPAMDDSSIVPVEPVVDDVIVPGDDPLDPPAIVAEEGDGSGEDDSMGAVAPVAEESAAPMIDPVVDEPAPAAEPLVDDVVIPGEDDTDLDDDITDEPIDVVFAEVMGEEALLDNMALELTQLDACMVAVASYGSNPTAVAIMQSQGLLDGTALESLGLESVTVEMPGGAESEMALEALSEKIQEKSAAYAAKILHVFQAAGSKILGGLTAVWDKVTGLVKTLTTGAWDKAKASGRVIKAHPYATIAAVATAMVAVAGIVVYCGGSMPTMAGGQKALESFGARVKDMVNKIKWPFGQVKVEQQGMKLIPHFSNTNATDVVGVLQEGSADKLGWTQNAVKAVMANATKAWTHSKDGLAAIGTRGAKLATEAAKATGTGVVSAAEKVKANPGGAAKVAAGAAVFTAHVYAGGMGTIAYVVTYFKTMASIVMGVYRLVKTIILGGLNLIINTFRKLVPSAAAA